MACSLLAAVLSEGGRRKAPFSSVPMACSSYAAHASYMQVCTTASARETIGAPSREIRTPSSAARSHRRTTFVLGGGPAIARLHNSAVTTAVALAGERLGRRWLLFLVRRPTLSLLQRLKSLQHPGAGGRVLLFVNCLPLRRNRGRVSEPGQGASGGEPNLGGFAA